MRDFLRMREYIDENPVKAGRAERAVDWVFGSLYHRLRRLTSLLDDVASDTFDGAELWVKSSVCGSTLVSTSGQPFRAVRRMPGIEQEQR
jgi:hypothetical protein